MLKLTLLVSLVLLAFDVHAQPSLAGHWKSDATLTMQFNNERSKLEDKTVSFLRQVMGRLTLTFTPKTVTLEMPDREYQTESGEQRHLVGFREVHSYRHLGRTQSAIAVLSKEPVSGAEVITVYNFEGPDTMWVYTGGSGRAFPTLHLREYFVRVHE